MTTQVLQLPVRNGTPICVPPALNVLTTYVLLEQEGWFEAEVDFVRRCVQPGEWTVDIGANFGLYTTALANAVGSDGKVVAFEPTSRTAAYLRETIRLNQFPQVEVVEAAVSDREGFAQLQIGASPEMNLLSTATSSDARHETVAIVTLDEYLQRCASKPIAFLKIDTEGHELQVLTGAKKTITRDEPVILFEIMRDGIADLALLHFLQPLGFEPYRLIPGLGVLAPVVAGASTDKYQLNLFACSAGKAAKLRERGLLARSFPAGLRVPDFPTSEMWFDNCYFPSSASAVGGCYDACLRHFAASLLPSVDGERRVSHLQQALELGTRACAENDSMARQITLGRIAADFGHREAATTILRSVADKIIGGGASRWEEPCLRPFPRRVASDVNAVDRLLLDALESLERLGSFSTAFGQPESPLLDYICAQPQCSPEMHRRRQFLLMRRGLQPDANSRAVLSIASPENLNSWFWITGNCERPPPPG